MRRYVRIALVWASVPAGMAAQTGVETAGLARAETERPAFELAGGPGFGLLVGSASDFLDGGFGPWVSGRWRPTGAGPIELAATAAWLPMKLDTDGLTGARADNALLTFMVGPALGVDLGPVRPWVGLHGGFTVLRHEREAQGRSRSGTSGSAAWGGSTGIVVRLNRSVALDGAAGVMDAGKLSFARAPPPDDATQPTGLIAREVAVLWLRLGIRIAL